MQWGSVELFFSLSETQLSYACCPTFTDLCRRIPWDFIEPWAVTKFHSKRFLGYFNCIVDFGFHCCIPVEDFGVRSQIKYEISLKVEEVCCEF